MPLITTTLSELYVNTSHDLLENLASFSSLRCRSVAHALEKKIKDEVVTVFSSRGRRLSVGLHLLSRERCQTPAVRPAPRGVKLPLSVLLHIPSLK